jgi:hypothetical protein
MVLAAATLVAAGAFAAVAARRPLAGLVFIVLNLLFSGVSRPLARLNGDIERREFLSAVFDVLFFGAIPIAFALADSSRALAASFLILGFAGAAASRIAMSGRDRKLGGSTVAKSGLPEFALMSLALFVSCIVPACFSVSAYVAGVACFGVTGVRVADFIESAG